MAQFTFHVKFYGQLMMPLDTYLIALKGHLVRVLVATMNLSEVKVGNSGVWDVCKLPRTVAIVTTYILSSPLS